MDYIHSNRIDTGTLFKLTYGLFVLTAADGAKDNGCIINTAAQITASPLKISIAVNKANFTHDMIAKTKAFNVSVLTESVPFDIFRQFGFQSGKSSDKFENCGYDLRTANGIRYIPQYTNGVLSAKVTDSYDYGTHTLWVADVTEAIVLSNERSASYQYYFDHIKPKKAQAQKKKGFVCKICGYVHEGEILPDDFICPLCKHGAADFEPIPANESAINKKYVCDVCGYTYDEAVGDPENGIPAGTKWKDLPDDFECPYCAAPKKQFSVHT